MRRFATAAGPQESQAVRGYLGCAVFGLAASWARSAIQASYSGVPRRGGAPGGMPPIHCGMSAIRSPAVFPAQDASRKPARHKSAQVRMSGNRIIHERVPRQCGGLDAQSRPGWDDNGSVNQMSGAFPAPMFVNHLRLPFAQSRNRNSYREN